MVQVMKQRNKTEDAPKRQIVNSATCYKFDLPDLVTKVLFLCLKSLDYQLRF